MFYENLKLILQKKNMTGADLCKKLQISSSNFTYWKTKLPRAEVIIEIAKLLNVSTDFLLTGKLEHYTLDEVELINLYRQADDRGKSRILKNAMIEVSEKEENVNEKFVYKKPDQHDDPDLEQISGRMPNGSKGG
jgi:transcriptional regulator with XRE-family HTH domain